MVVEPLCVEEKLQSLNYILTRSDKKFMRRIKERLERLERRCDVEWYDPSELCAEVIGFKNLLEDLINQKALNMDDITNEYNRVTIILQKIQ